MNRPRHVATSVALLVLALLVSGCATTHQTRSVRPSGFLGDYSKLRKGKGDEALLVYVNPDADFSKYSKILMEPVVLYAGPGSMLRKGLEEDVKALLSYFDATVREQLGKDYTFVTEPGPDVLRLRVALTDGDPAHVVVNVVSSVVPVGLAISSIKRVAGETHLGVSEISAEIELLDSQTAVRLAAAVDERAGTKFPGPAAKFSTWEQVRDAFDFWAERMRIRLAELRGDTTE